MHSDATMLHEKIPFGNTIKKDEAAYKWPKMDEKRVCLMYRLIMNMRIKRYDYKKKEAALHVCLKSKAHFFRGLLQPIHSFFANEPNKNERTHTQHLVNIDVNYIIWLTSLSRSSSSQNTILHFE